MSTPRSSENRHLYQSSSAWRGTPLPSGQSLGRPWPLPFHFLGSPSRSLVAVNIYFVLCRDTPASAPLLRDFTSMLTCTHCLQPPLNTFVDVAVHHPVDSQRGGEGSAIDGSTGDGGTGGKGVSIPRAYMFSLFSRTLT